MIKMETGDVCMVTRPITLEVLHRSNHELLGKLVYGPGVLAGGVHPYVFDEDFESFTAFDCDAERDLTPIDPDNLEKSLASAYKKFKFGGRVNPFTKVPLEQLKQEFREYELHFYKYLAQKPETSRV